MRRQLANHQRQAHRAFLQLVEEGQRQGSIREDVPAADIAWGMLAFGWAQDVSTLLGVGEYTTGGSGIRNMKRLLATFQPSGVDPPEVPTGEKT